MGRVMTTPITPDEVVSVKKDELPEGVLDIFNRLIAKNWNGSSSKIYYGEAIDKIRDELSISQAEISNRHLLDVEDIYRAAGWDVEVDNPGYNETYKGSYTFRKSRR